MLADAIGMPLDEVTTGVEYAVALSGVEEAIGGLRIADGVQRLAKWPGGADRYSPWYVTRDLALPS